jgi:hypothetical protein
MERKVGLIRANIGFCVRKKINYEFALTQRQVLVIETHGNGLASHGRPEKSVGDDVLSRLALHLMM